MPSATTADSNDSIAPSISIAKAGPISSMTFAPVTSSQCHEGSRGAMPPNALPMVATPSKEKIACKTVVTTNATSGPSTPLSGPGIFALKIRTARAMIDNAVADEVQMRQRLQ